MRILVINDSNDLLELCQHMLEAAGHEVAITTDASGVLAEIMRFQPDAIVLDWMLEDRTGGDVLEELQRCLPRPPPVLVMSSRDDVAQEAKRLGAQSFLRKPFRDGELVDAVEALT